MKLLKRVFICSVMAITCLFAVIAFTACDDKPTEGLNYAVILNDGTPVSYRVTGIGTATDSKIIVPDAYNGLPVTEIGSYAFYQCENITSVSLPESVTSVADFSFYGCTSLKQVSIPDGLIYIGNASFGKCSSLTSIKIPGSIMIFGSSSFYECTSLKNVELREGIKFLGMQMFQGCTSLTSINIPASVTSYGAQAFSNCTGLKSISISQNVTNIGFRVFEGCSSLKSAKFGNSSGWMATGTTSDESLNISEESLSDASMAATYLTSTYSNYVWKKG